MPCLTSVCQATHWILGILVSPRNIAFPYLKFNSVLIKSACPDELPPYAAFHLGPYCLPKFPLWGFPVLIMRI